MQPGGMIKSSYAEQSLLQHPGAADRGAAATCTPWATP